MSKVYETELFKGVYADLLKTKIIDCHEHLQQDSELIQAGDIHIGRLFSQYADCDLISAGMPLSDMKRVQTEASLAPKDRWQLLSPWYKKAYNTAYCEAIRIAVCELYGISELSEDSVEALTAQMLIKISQGFTRRIFDQANIDYAMTHPLSSPNLVFDPDIPYDCFICDMIDDFTTLEIQALEEQSGIEILCVDDYLRVIDFYFERYAHRASAFKTIRAYDRILYWEDVGKGEIENTFNRLLSFNDRPDKHEIKSLEDYIMHYLCHKCGEYGIRMKFHTGLHAGNGNMITNSRAALMSNLFMKYPKTGFDIYHVSYPYQEEATVLAKIFPNVTVDFCWMWVVNPSAGRRALSDMLDAVPANKIHGFGGDYRFVEGSYGHASIARREIARVLCEKIEEGRFSEEYAIEIGHMLLRYNAIENFSLDKKRQIFS
jgi:hypothetical protein